MNKSELVNSTELISVIDNAIEQSLPCCMSYMSKGRWHRVNVEITSLNRKSLTLYIKQNNLNPPNIQVDQPVGFSIEIDQSKYLFESKIIGYDTDIPDGSSGNILIRKPANAEKMQRRSYDRVAVPHKLKVNTLFWHRGYTDDSIESPIDNYWQGRMIDLSAGGSQVYVSAEYFENFKEGQLVGMQFTPMPYEKPLIVEAQIKHIGPVSDNLGILSLGIEFLGLEASSEGRIKLEHIVNAVSLYQNHENSDAEELMHLVTSHC